MSVILVSRILWSSGTNVFASFKHNPHDHGQSSNANGKWQIQPPARVGTEDIDVHAEEGLSEWLIAIMVVFFLLEIVLLR